MDHKDNSKWYFKNWPLVISFLCVGPFMLPLVWVNPHLSKKAKVIISVVILVLTYLLVIVAVKSLKSISDYYRLLAV